MYILNNVQIQVQVPSTPGLQIYAGSTPGNGCRDECSCKIITSLGVQYCTECNAWLNATKLIVTCQPEIIGTAYLMRQFPGLSHVLINHRRSFTSFDICGDFFRSYKRHFFKESIVKCQVLNILLTRGVKTRI